MDEDTLREGGTMQAGWRSLTMCQAPLRVSSGWCQPADPLDGLGYYRPYQ